IGDNVYTRQADFYSRAGLLYRYTHTRSHPDLQRLLRTGHHYAIWDDHDYGPNDADISNPMKEIALEVFKLFFPRQKYGLPEAPGVFYRFSYSDIDFFMLDDRYYRSPSNMKDGPHKTQLGEVQLEWLKNSLLSSNAPFKIICVGGQFLNEKTNKESFNLYRYEREKIINFIKENNIEGVVFLTGDRHHAELLRKEIGGFYPL
ncbi:MAG: alkaline phosphatase family protein, partial [Bacteroidia bacterium]|nr:alkaline phosphatase family protein [Bacteroidia bacterium]